MNIPLVRYQRNRIVSDPQSEQYTYLRFEPGYSRTKTLEDFAQDIELIGSMSREDVVHVLQSATRLAKSTLKTGDKVKWDGLGTFYLSFNCTGTADPEDCTVRNIRKVNIRFRADSTMRMVNDTTATTRGGENNVKFYIKSDTSGNTGSNTGNGDGGDDGGFTPDPNA